MQVSTVLYNTIYTKNVAVLFSSVYCFIWILASNDSTDDDRFSVDDAVMRMMYLC